MNASDRASGTGPWVRDSFIQEMTETGIPIGIAHSK